MKFSPLFFRCLLGLLAWAGGLLGSPAPAGAQPAPAAAPSLPVEVRLVPGPVAVPVTGYYTLAFKLRNAPLGAYTEFPEIEGFKKAGKTSTTTTRLVQGRRFSELTLTQRYAPYGEGDYAVPPFQLTVNGVVVRSPGAKVRVGPAAAEAQPATKNEQPKTNQPVEGIGSLDQLFGKPKPEKFYEPPDHAYLALEADQRQVFVGQGVRVGLYFYLQPADVALLAFHDFNDQLPPLLRKLRQPSAWEAPVAQASSAPDTLRFRNGQTYLRFRLNEATYYPLTAEPLRFPPLALTMTKFRLLKEPEPGQENRLATYKTYVARGLDVAVRPLPPAPGGAAAGAVPVGEYTLREEISPDPLRTGRTFAYVFGVVGRGNLAAVQAPAPAPRPGLQLAVYGPTAVEETLPGGLRRKAFRYRLVARRPGPLPFDSLFRLAFFNPATARYDTLQAALRPRVQGTALEELPAVRPEDDPFYGPALADADAQLQPLGVYADVRRYAYWIVGGLLLVAAAGWWRAGR